MTEQDAITKLTEMVDATADPALSSDEVGSLLQESLRVQIFAPGAYFGVGDRVLPSAANTEARGVCYVVVSPGLAAAEPGWTAAPGVTAISGTVQFRFLGPYDGIAWDLNGAAWLGWKKKAGYAAKNFGFKDRDAQYDRQQIYDHCLEMMNRYVPTFPV